MNLSRVGKDEFRIPPPFLQGTSSLVCLGHSPIKLTNKDWVGAGDGGYAQTTIKPGGKSRFQNRVSHL